MGASVIPWAVAKHGTKGTREWRKLHIGVNESGFIVAHSLTESSVDDASVVPDLLNQVSGEVERFTAGGAYDTTRVLSKYSSVPELNNADAPRDPVLPASSPAAPAWADS